MMMMINKKEALSLITGGLVAGATLAAQHYGLKRIGLRRTDAYIAGTLGLDLGYATYAALSGKSFSTLAAFLAVQVAGGVTVKGLYRLDQSQPDGLKDRGMLAETLADNERLRGELEKMAETLRVAYDLQGHISIDDLLELAAHALTAEADLSRAEASIKALLRKHDALQQRLRMTAIRVAASRRANAGKQLQEGKAKSSVG